MLTLLVNRSRACQTPVVSTGWNLTTHFHALLLYEFTNLFNICKAIHRAKNIDDNEEAFDNLPHVS